MLQTTDGWLNYGLGVPLLACRNLDSFVSHSLVSRLSQLENKPGLFLPVAQTGGLEWQLEGVPSEEASFREAT